MLWFQVYLVLSGNKQTKTTGAHPVSVKLLRRLSLSIAALYRG